MRHEHAPASDGDHLFFCFAFRTRRTLLHTMCSIAEEERSERWVRCAKAPSTPGASQLLLPAGGARSSHAPLPPFYSYLPSMAASHFRRRCAYRCCCSAATSTNGKPARSFPSQSTLLPLTISIPTRVMLRGGCISEAATALCSRSSPSPSPLSPYDSLRSSFLGKLPFNKVALCRREYCDAL